MAIPVGYGFSQYLFDRDWSVLINPVVKSGTDANQNPLYTVNTNVAQSLLFARQPANKQNPNASFSNLKITFDITKTSESFSNNGTLEIWNLSPTSRKSIQGGAQITLQAGYSGLMKEIWVADILDIGVSTERRGPDIVTILKGSSSGRNITQNIVFRSFPAGTKLSSIISYMASILYTPQTSISGVQDFAFNQPYAFCCSVKDALDKICIPNGLQWFIQDNKLYVLPVGSSVTNIAVVLSSGVNTNGQTSAPRSAGFGNTGLIEIPSQAVATGVTKFKCLLNPDVAPGTLVQIASQNVNGFFIVRKCRYKGDSHGHDWHIEAESDTQLKNASTVQSAAFSQGNIA